MSSKPPRVPCSIIGGTVLAATIAVVAVVLGALSSGNPLLSIAATPTPGPSGLTGGGISIYFTDPEGPNAQSLRGGPDRRLADAIDQARLTVDVAIYDLNLWSVRDALIEAQGRGVAVRVVTESDNLEGAEIQSLLAAGIPVLGDRREGLMHNKFAIIDRSEIWSGSMNYTVNGAYRNDNNLIRIRSSRLAQDYLAEFEEMFVADSFGPVSANETPYPVVVIDGTQVEVYFSPDDGAAARIESLIGSAQKSVRFLAFSFTADGIAEAMLARSRAGVRVEGVFEAGQVESNRGTEYGRLRSAGLDVHLDGNPRNMHHKVIIIDDELVITGSYNFSASAENRNDENLLVIHNPQIARLYLDEFERIYAAAAP